MNPKVDTFFQKANKWKDEMETLRNIVLDCQLNEELKWRQPCYTFQNKNIVIIGAFKEYCILGFFKGALLHDEHHLLTKPGENTQGGRQIRFRNVQEVKKLTAILKAYIFEAIEVEKAGIKIEYKKPGDFTIPEELQEQFNMDPAFKIAFESLTPGRQRAYNLFFSAAKQSKTRVERIKKYIPRILNGFGMNDCTCGLSKKMPNCDGSHKLLQKKHS